MFMYVNELSSLCLIFHLIRTHLHPVQSFMPQDCLFQIIHPNPKTSVKMVKNHFLVLMVGIIGIQLEITNSW